MGVPNHLQTGMILQVTPFLTRSALTGPPQVGASTSPEVVKVVELMSPLGPEKVYLEDHSSRCIDYKWLITPISHTIHVWYIYLHLP